MKSRWFAMVLVLIGASSYGLLSPLIKTAYQEGWNELEVSASQMTAAAILLWLVVLMQRKAWSNPFKGPWVKLSLVGMFGLAATTLLYNTALAEMDATVAIVLLFQFTWITIVMEAVANRKWPERNQWLAVGIIMLGTLCSVEAFDADWTRFTYLGIVCGLGSAMSYSFFLFMAGRLETHLHPFMKSAVMVTGALPLLYLIYPPVVFVQPGNGSLLLWGIILGLLGQVIPTTAFMVGIPRIGSTLASLLGAMELPVGIVASLLILHEAVHGVQWFGMLLILAGIIVAEKRKRLEVPVSNK
ncbi:DMT family transporter [Paenibacillus agricola]|uniref:DMT family transporter n=1 Tax=Paenibacillus agricola TaxID=2716264 RepID=A0ABX0JHL1_9BACL|nr:DMT family transporter [Paenibacillus agricola]NHN35316.1 DMT family transporter [Paenibacillus agricola]